MRHPKSKQQLIRLWCGGGALSMLGAVVAAVLSLSMAEVRADGVRERYFEQLRSRRLFAVAEGECLRRLSQPDVSADERAEFTLELSRTFAEHARYTHGDEQADLWQRANNAIDEFLAQHPQHPRRMLFEAQSALIVANQADDLRWQADLLPFEERLKQRALKKLLQAAEGLGKVEKRLDEVLTDQARVGRAKAAGDGELTPYELRSLLLNIRYRLGVVLQDHAELLPSESPDRVELLLHAEGWFRPLAGGLPGDELTWNAQVFLASNQRLRGNLKQADAILETIVRKQPPADVHDRIVAEQTRVMLAGNRFTEAAQFLLDYRRGGAPQSGEILFLNVQTVLALWNVATQKQDASTADQLMQQAESHVARAERDVGGYWAYRCRLILDLAREAAEYGVELAPLTRQARSLYAAGKIEEAAAAYAEAARLAHDGGRDDLAMELGYIRASILHETADYAKAGEAFRELAYRFPTHRRAAAAHLLWAYALGKQYDERRTKERREAYTAALAAHRERFAGDPTRADATWMLAQLQEQRLQYTKALELYDEIADGSQRGADAQVAVARCYESILGRLRELQQPADEWEAAAVGRLRQFVVAFPLEPAPLTLTQGELAVRLARIELNRRRPDYAAADPLLERVASNGWRAAGSENESSSRAALHTLASQLRIVSLAGQGRASDAQAFVSQLSQSSVDDVLGILDGLMQPAGEFDDRTKRELAQLQLKAADALESRREELDERQQVRLDRCLAQAYAATSQTKKAIDIYEKLRQKFPRDERLLRTFAGLLMECHTTTCLEQAKEHWRTLETLSRPGSEAWLEARYHVAWCAGELKQYDECRKLIGVTRLLYPELGSDELRAKFNRLEEAARKQAISRN